MNLYIRIVDGKIFEHPITEENMLMAFPDVDLNNLPPEFRKFERVDAPILGPYQKNLRVEYVMHGDICRDVFSCERMTDEEKLAKQNEVKAAFAESPNYASWKFNEETCVFDPPVPYPNNNKFYNWDEENTKWVESNEE